MLAIEHAKLREGEERGGGGEKEEEEREEERGGGGEREGGEEKERKMIQYVYVYMYLLSWFLKVVSQKLIEDFHMSFLLEEDVISKILKNLWY